MVSVYAIRDAIWLLDVLGILPLFSPKPYGYCIEYQLFSNLSQLNINYVSKQNYILSILTISYLPCLSWYITTNS